jgi:hypothetical protein
MIDLLVEVPDFELSLQIHLVVMLGTKAIPVAQSLARRLGGL